MRDIALCVVSVKKSVRKYVRFLIDYLSAVTMISVLSCSNAYIDIMHLKVTTHE